MVQPELSFIMLHRLSDRRAGVGVPTPELCYRPGPRQDSALVRRQLGPPLRDHRASLTNEADKNWPAALISPLAFIPKTVCYCAVRVASSREPA